MNATLPESELESEPSRLPATESTFDDSAKADNHLSTIWPADNKAYATIVAMDLLNLKRFQDVDFSSNTQGYGPDSGRPVHHLVQAYWQVVPPTPTQITSALTYSNTRLIREFMLEMQDAKNGVPPCLYGPIADNIHDLLCVIPGPASSPYEGGVFYLRIQTTPEYPRLPPRCCFLTQIYHPNIGSEGEICIDLLGSAWSSIVTISHVLISITGLLDNPIIDEDYMREIADTYRDDRQRYDENVRQFTETYAQLHYPTPAMLARPLKVFEDPRQILGAPFESWPPRDWSQE